MTRFRYWLADLISGGELTYFSEQSTERFDRIRALERSLAMASNLRAERDAQTVMIANIALEIDNKNGWHNSKRFSDALRAIAAEAKPTSNATVRRMARIAQEALK